MVANVTPNETCDFHNYDELISYLSATPHIDCVQFPWRKAFIVVHQHAVGIGVQKPFLPTTFHEILDKKIARFNRALARSKYLLDDYNKLYATIHPEAYPLLALIHFLKFASGVVDSEEGDHRLFWERGIGNCAATALDALLVIQESKLYPDCKRQFAVTLSPGHALLMKKETQGCKLIETNANRKMPTRNICKELTPVEIAAYGVVDEQCQNIYFAPLGVAATIGLLISNIISQNLWEIGRCDDALPYELERLQLNPQEANVYVNLIYTFFDIGQPGQAMKLAREAIRRQPYNLLLYNSIANGYLHFRTTRDHHQRALHWIIQGKQQARILRRKLSKIQTRSVSLPLAEEKKLLDSEMKILQELGRCNDAKKLVGSFKLEGLDTLLLLANFFRKTNKINTAKKIYKYILKITAKILLQHHHICLIFAKAEAYYRLGKICAALPYIHQCTRERPYKLKYQLLLQKIFLRHNYLQGVVQQAKIILTMLRDDSAVQSMQRAVMIGEQLGYCGEFTRAINIFKHFQKRRYKNGHYYYHYAQIEAQRGKHGKAIRKLKKAHQLSRYDTQIMHKLGIAYFQRQRYREVVDIYTKAIKIFPEPELYLQRSLAYVEIGNTQSATKDALQVIDMIKHGKTIGKSAMDNMTTLAQAHQLLGNRHHAQALQNKVEKMTVDWEKRLQEML